MKTSDRLMGTDRSLFLFRAERLSRAILAASWLAAMAALVVCGVVYGVALGRKRPAIHSLQVIGPVHAGGDMRVREGRSIPENCIPRVSRRIVFPPDALSAGHRVIQVITDATVTGEGDILFAVPRDTPLRTGRFEETVSTEGCGAMSGILPPLITHAYDPEGQIGVAVTILPQEPLPTIPAH